MPLSKSHGREMQMSLHPFALPHSRTRARRAHPARFMGGERSDYSAEKVKWHPDERSDWLATKWNKTSRIGEFYYSNNDDAGDDAIDRRRDGAVYFISTWQSLMQTELKFNTFHIVYYVKNFEPFGLYFLCYYYLKWSINKNVRCYKNRKTRVIKIRRLWFLGFNDSINSFFYK